MKQIFSLYGQMDIYNFCICYFNYSSNRFPADGKQCAAWIRAVGRIDVKTKQEWKPTKNSVVCSSHFICEDFRLDRGVTLLKPGAVPTVFNIPTVKVS
jgi:hypothetical protein